MRLPATVGSESWTPIHAVSSAVNPSVCVKVRCMLSQEGHARTISKMASVNLSCKEHLNPACFLWVDVSSLPKTGYTDS